VLSFRRLVAIWVAVLPELGYQQSARWDKLADAASPEEIARAAQRLGCRSVAFTYNDPVIFAEIAREAAAYVKTVAVTAGYITQEARSDFFQHMDAARRTSRRFDPVLPSPLLRDLTGAER
jgi:hypothetical protein